MPRNPKRFVITLIFQALLLAQVERSPAADSPKPSRVQNQIDVTIIHVDKYGVYAPGLIFYWDSEMSKQKVAALTSLAEKSRNRKVLVTYSVHEDIKKDKRPLLVDILPQRDEQTTKEVVSKLETQQPAFGEERPVQKSGDPERSDQERSSIEPKQAPFERKEKPAQGMVMEEPGRTGREAPEIVQSGKIQPSEPRPMQTAMNTASVTKEEAMAFVKRLLALNEKKDLTAIMSHFADEVNYYDRGIVSKDYVKRDLGYYFRNWDTISSSLEGEIVLIVTDQHDVRIVKFISTYAVENSKKSVTGKTENVWKIQKINNQLKIVDEKQRIIRSDSR